ncbi:DUF4396 domain-containing protein [Sphingomonas koreensis]|nr:DUF4396 domain-containing protein [Sphingomonas koreensis]
MSMAHFPSWLHALSIASLALAATCAIIIALDELRRPQKMWIMYVVWPLTALFGSLLWLTAYYAYGRGPASGDPGDAAEPPFPAMVLKGASHCGAGCTLGDIVAEWTAFAVPAIAVFFGYGSLFADKIFAIWIPDFILAFLIGVVFQYFTIKPMRDLSVGQGIWQAIKADTASISSWQVGMYGVMAIIQFLIFRPLFGGTAEVNTPEFWFAMQGAMIAGFCTAFPVNWLLIRKGLKEKM